MERRKFTSKIHEGEYLNYICHCPDSVEKLPLVVCVHGAGGRGDDISLVETSLCVNEAIKHVGKRAVIVAPQCHAKYWFDLFEVLTEFIDEMRHLDGVDIDRVYITGASMGGYTTWQMCLSHPEWFAAAVPVCGGGMYWAAAGLKNLPIWATHGALDTTVLPEETVHMVKAINQKGGNAKITVFADATHDAWTPTYTDPEIWEWMFSQKRGSAEAVSDTTEELKSIIKEG